MKKKMKKINLHGYVMRVVKMSPYRLLMRVRQSASLLTARLSYR